jgi:hypothetical protein
MTPTLEMVEAQVLALGEVDRARLLDRLVNTLDDDPAIESAWMDEARRRNAEMDAGAVQPIALADALTTLRAGLA